MKTRKTVEYRVIADDSSGSRVEVIIKSTGDTQKGWAPDQAKYLADRVTDGVLRVVLLDFHARNIKIE